MPSREDEGTHLDFDLVIDTTKMFQATVREHPAEVSSVKHNTTKTTAMVRIDYTIRAVSADSLILGERIRQVAG